MKSRWPLKIVLALATTAAATAVYGNPFVVDQRDPKFQAAQEHLARAAQALSVLQHELALSEEAMQLPGVDYSKLNASLSPLEDTLKVILNPEKKRHAHKTIVPDGIFFTPLPIGVTR